jgi:hypothetical protein
MRLDPHRRTLSPEMATGDSEPRPCRIEQQLGRREICPGEACAFWDPGEAGRGSGCPFDELDLAGRADLAQWLHDLRSQLEEFGRADTAETRRQLHERINASQDGG